MKSKTENKDQFLIVVAGPTAVGKTETAISIAKHFGCEIISADSRQFYIEMEIGTAKPSAAELLAVPHHFVNSISITETFDVSKFENKAIEKLNELYQNNCTAILCGGSGLFVNAVLDGLDEIPEADPDLRIHLNNQFEINGIEFLQTQLEQLDPEYFNRVDLKNSRRLMRAIEVCLQTGKPYSQIISRPKPKRNFKTIMIGLQLNKEDLHKRIDERVNRMFKIGLVDEVKSLMPYKQFRSMKTIGYDEVVNFLEGKWSLEEATEKIKLHTRQLAKRQMTWYRKNNRYKWFHPNELKDIIGFIQSKMIE